VSAGPDIEVREARPSEIPEVLAVLCSAYGEDRFDQEWFDWKHRGGPWGPSVVYATLLGEQMIGTVFILPWELTGPAGPVPSCRIVDGGTRPEARGKGALRWMTAMGREAWEGSNRGISTATATPTAQRVHLRNGATALDPIRQQFSTLVPAPAAIEEGNHVVDGFVPSTDGLATNWTPDALRWRFDARSGLDSRFIRLRDADEPHGAVVRRLVQQGVPTLVVELLWGPPAVAKRLVRAAMWRERTALVLAPVGPGTAPVPGRRVRPSGATLLCSWDNREQPVEDRPVERVGWRLSLADVGGVM